MQIANDYDKEVYNGDIGFIDDVDPDLGELTSNLDGRTDTYAFGELDTLVQAYAATIHKSQGSEYPAVVIPVMTQHDSDPGVLDTPWDTAGHAMEATAPPPPLVRASRSLAR